MITFHRLYGHVPVILTANSYINSCVWLLITRVLEPSLREELLLNQSRTGEAQQDVRAASLVVGSTGPAATERLLADEGRSGLAVCEVCRVSKRIRLSQGREHHGGWFDSLRYRFPAEYRRVSSASLRALRSLANTAPVSAKPPPLLSTCSRTELHLSSG